MDETVLRTLFEFIFDWDMKNYQDCRGKISKDHVKHYNIWILWIRIKKNKLEYNEYK